eukprot:5019086-Amphidinium_carterae.4
MEQQEASMREAETLTARERDEYYGELESSLNERALEETDRNRRKIQAHGAVVPQALGMDGKDKGKPKGKGKDRDKNKGGKGGNPQGARGKPPSIYRNRDDNPNDTRPICPEFLKDRGCNKGGQCTMRHPTRVGKCLRCGAKGHSVSECLRPRRDVPRRTTREEDLSQKVLPNPLAADVGMEEDDYEEGTTVPPGATIEDVTDQPSASAANIIPWYSPEPSAMLTARESTPLTPILDTGASHCLLPASHLTKDEAELATRVHLRVANGSMTRALIYQNIIYALKVPRTLISIGHVTHALGLTFVWSGDTPQLVLSEDSCQYEVLTATLWNSLPCITEWQMKAIVEALTTFTLLGKVWTLKDWEKGLNRTLTLVPPRSAVGTPVFRSPSGMEEVEDVSDRGEKEGILETHEHSSEVLVTPCVMLSSVAPAETSGR